MTVVIIPTVFFLMPESVHWLARKQPAGALDRINRILRRLGHQTIAALPPVPADTRKLSTREIFRPGLVATTMVVTGAYFLHVVTFYFLAKWIPTIVVSMGFAPSTAGYVLSWLNVGGAAGGTVIGLLSQRYPIKTLTLGVMMLSTIAVTLFGRAPAHLVQLTAICMVAGFCTNASITGMYAIFAKAFPTHVRASGTGFAVGLGRGGSVLAPILAGFLFKFGYSLPTVATIMSLGSLLAAGVLLNLHVDESK